MPAIDELTRLLEHPAIWRGAGAACPEALATGFGSLDERLPGKGWPRSGLIEILVPRFGVGELSLLLPALAALTQRPMARWCVWVGPPLEPFAPALAAHGIVLEHVLVVRSVAATSKSLFTAEESANALWAFEQSLGSGACDLVMAWVQGPRSQQIRRLQLAAERGRTLGILFRPRRAGRESSHAVLRMALEPTRKGIRVTLLKCRGGLRGPLELVLPRAESEI